MAEHTKGPWHACMDGKCQCKTVSCGDHPVATVIAGEWGDDYPAVRLVGESSLDQRAEAYMDRIAYGSVDEETARANARLIASAPDLLRLLMKAAPAVAELHAHDIGCPDCDDDGIHCAFVDEIDTVLALASPEPPAPEAK